MNEKAIPNFAKSTNKPIKKWSELKKMTRRIPPSAAREYETMNASLIPKDLAIKPDAKCPMMSAEHDKVELTYRLPGIYFR